MRIFGMAIGHNLLAVILGMSMVLLCSIISYLFQRKLFGRHRGKAANAMSKSRPKL